MRAGARSDATGRTRGADASLDEGTGKEEDAHRWIAVQKLGRTNLRWNMMEGDNGYRIPNEVDRVVDAVGCNIDWGVFNLELERSVARNCMEHL